MVYDGRNRTYLTGVVGVVLDICTAAFPCQDGGGSGSHLIDMTVQRGSFSPACLWPLALFAGVIAAHQLVLAGKGRMIDFDLSAQKYLLNAGRCEI